MTAKVIKITLKAYVLVQIIQLLEDEVLSFETITGVFNDDPKYPGIDIQEILRRVTPISQAELSSSNSGDDFSEGLNDSLGAIMRLSNELTEYVKQNYAGDVYPQIVASLNKGDIATQQKLEKLLEVVAQLMDCGYSFEDIVIFFIPARMTLGRGVQQPLCDGWHALIRKIFAGMLRCEILSDDGFRQRTNRTIEHLNDLKSSGRGGNSNPLYGFLRGMME